MMKDPGPDRRKTVMLRVPEQWKERARVLAQGRGAYVPPSVILREALKRGLRLMETDAQYEAKIEVIKQLDREYQAKYPKRCRVIEETQPLRDEVGDCAREVISTDCLFSREKFERAVDRLYVALDELRAEVEVEEAEGR